MSYNAHTQVSAENISRLPFIKGQFVYYFRQNSVNTCGILYSLSREDYDKAKYRLAGQDIAEIKAGDVVYLMPSCKIPLFKIKNHVKKLGAKLTTEIDKATCFVGNDNISEILNVNTQERSNSLLFDASFSNYLAEDSVLHEQLFNKTDAYKNLISDNIRSSYETIISKNVLRVSNIEHTIRSGNYFITPAAANILYNSILKKAPVINEDLLATQLAPSIVIDEDSYETIMSMLDSRNKDDKNTAVEIICNCDIEKSLIYLWKIGQTNAYDIRSTNSKNARLFQEESKWRELTGLNAEDFIVDLKARGLLTKEWCKMLLKEASDIYKDTLKSNMFKLVLIPTQEYFEYVEKTDVFEFNHKTYKQEDDEPTDD